VRRSAAIAVLTGAVCCAGSAQAELPVAFSSLCPEAQTFAKWCAPQLQREGWKVKYKNERSKDSEGGYWLSEVWIRDQSTVECVLGSLGPIRVNVYVNRCQELSEVSE
jgi:hypothetical protein